MSNSLKFNFVKFCCVSLIIGACKPPEKEGGSGTLSSGDEFSAWDAERSRREGDLKNYIESKQMDYRWFSDLPFGQTKPEHVSDPTRSLPGYSFIMLKLLPIVAPDQWGSKENFLDVVGLFKDERLKDYPIARGFGWSGLARENISKHEDISDVDFSSLTCGACHVGRVRLANGTFKYIDAGANGQFTLPQFRLRQLNTLKFAAEKGKKKNPSFTDGQAIADTFIDALKTVKDGYFYNNYKFGNRVYDTSYEKAQKDLFIKNANRIAESYFKRASLEVGSLLELLKKNYSKEEHQNYIINNTAGMADATGVSTSMQFIVQKVTGLNPDPTKVMPPMRGLTDIMVVWDQKNREAGWNESKTGFSSGGGQWNGNIPIPIYRNMAAQLTIGIGVDTDLRVSVFGRSLLGDMPPPPFPFRVNMTKADKGKKLFDQNCADCHRPRNGRVYDVGSDLGRTQVVSGEMVANAQANLFKFCNPSTALKMPDGRIEKPCAEYNGVSLKDKSKVTLLDAKDRSGIQARVLGGLWAQAPYLHTGSVPTLRHLLLPSTRPAKFKKGTLSYDEKNVGFKWELGESEGYVYDTEVFAADSVASGLGNPTSRAGHDKNITENGKTYRLDWSDNKQELEDLLEYLKTL